MYSYRLSEISIFGVLFFLLFFSCIESNTDLSGNNADQVARNIEVAINKEKWDRTKWIQWTFPGPRNYLWDRERNYLETDWDHYRVVMDLNTKKGLAYSNDTLLFEGDLRSILDKAWSNFCNDAFWLNAPAKLFDPGTKRSLVTREDTLRLKVEYTSGGVTPGDYYLWNFDQNYLPTSFEMYVSVISEPGVLATWERWKKLESGAMIAPKHTIGSKDLTLSNIKSGDDFTDFQKTEDPFLELIN